MRLLKLFLVGGVAAAVLGLTACGDGSGDDETSTGTSTAAATNTSGASSTPAGSVDAAPMVNGLPTCLPPGTEIKGSPFEPSANPSGTTTLELVPSQQLFVGDNNMTVGLVDPETKGPIGGAQVRMTIYDLSGGQQVPVCQVEGVGSAPGVGEVSEHIHPGGVVHEHGGEDEDRAVHYAHVHFDKAGNWGLAVEAILKDGTRAFGTVLMQVEPEPLVPMPGEPAIKSDNLTKDDVEDISEIDSGDPPSDMHDLTIREVVDAGRPAVVVFSTPAYCTSAFCGPVNQEVEDLQEDYRDRVDFIHIEIYRDFSANPPVFNPTAREWLLQSNGLLIEPAVYVIGKDGVIFEKWDGPVARNIMEPAVEAVANGAVYEAP